MKKTTVSISTIFTFIFFFTLGACTKKTGNDCRPTGQTRGFSLSPRGFPKTFDRIDDFFVEIQNFKDSGVMWSGLWRDDPAGANAGTVPAAADIVEEKSQTYCYTPTVVFNWRSDTTLYISVPGNSDNSWLNQEAKNAFLEMLTKFVTNRKPPYIFLGNENDFYYEQQPLDYDHWISFYNSAYDTIKAISADTMVGPVFNFEHIAGSGQLNAWVTPHWEAFLHHDMSKVDVIGLTLYPFFSRTRPADIPQDYLDPLLTRIGTKPVAILETGWPAAKPDGFNPSWEVSEQHQSEYIDKLTELVSGRDVRLINWLFLYEPDYDTASDQTNIFSSVSLKTKENISRPALDKWLNQ